MFEPDLDDQVPGLSIASFPASTGEYVGASWKEGVYRNPTPAVIRMAELAEANAQGQARVRRTGSGALVRIKPRAEQLGVDQLQEEYGMDGLLKFQHPMTRKAAEILRDRKVDELFRFEALTNREGGFWQGAAGLAVGFAASFRDPINVALMAVPVVGEAKLAGALARPALQGARLTRAALRARVGAVDGILGAGVAEIPVQLSARQDDSLYGMSDSFMALGFGAVGGATLRTSGGAVADVFSHLSGATRQNLFQYALSQVQRSDELTDIDRIMRVDSAFSFAEAQLGRRIKTFSEAQNAMRQFKLAESDLPIKQTKVTPEGNETSATVPNYWRMTPEQFAKQKTNVHLGALARYEGHEGRVVFDEDSGRVVLDTGTDFVEVRNTQELEPVADVRAPNISVLGPRSFEYKGVAYSLDDLTAPKGKGYVRGPNGEKISGSAGVYLQRVLNEGSTLKEGSLGHRFFVEQALFRDGVASRAVLKAHYPDLLEEVRGRDITFREDVQDIKDTAAGNMAKELDDLNAEARQPKTVKQDTRADNGKNPDLDPDADINQRVRAEEQRLKDEMEMLDEENLHPDVAQEYRALKEKLANQTPLDKIKAVYKSIGACVLNE